MEGREKTLGMERADTPRSVNDLGVVLHDQKQYEAAQQMYRRAMQGREMTLGPEHADTLRSIGEPCNVLPA